MNKRLKIDDPIERIFLKTRTNKNGCWEWLGYVNRAQYGMTAIKGKTYYVHRLFYQLLNGPLPESIFVCHHCDNPRCCNPEHLFHGTRQENIEDQVRKNRHHNTKKTHCKRGHEYNVENTRFITGGRRECIKCNKIRSSDYYYKNVRGKLSES